MSHILIAEDEHRIASFVQKGLRAKGFTTTTVTDGDQAYRHARSDAYDLMILDLGLPIRDGMSVLRALRAERSRLPVVILTAFGQRELVERARDAGAMAYLVKPFFQADLIPAMELAVSRFAELHALEREVASLSERLETRKLVERAKSVLIASNAMTEPEAFAWIQKAAMDRRTTMRAVAQVVIDNLGGTRP